MKKSAKSFILLGITTSVIAAGGIIQNIKPLKVKLEEKKILGYNHSPASALDNVFIEDGMTILPFIYENPDEFMTKAKIEEEFRKAGLTIKTISTGNKIGTGTEITVNENSYTYTVLIYGDVNADGAVDIDDAVDLITAVRFQETKGLRGIYYKAGNVDNEPKELDISDAVDIITFIRGLKRIPAVEPESIKEQDAIIEAIEITNPPKAEHMGDSLDFTGATLTARAKSGKITENIPITESMITPGTYNKNILTEQYVEVTYGGQKATFPVTLKEATVTKLELVANPDKDKYNYGETELNLAGLRIKVDWDTGKTTYLEATDITPEMLSGNDLSTEGMKTITVTYGGQTAEFKVTVLNKISALEITADGRDNDTTTEAGGYRVDTNAEFTIGTIQAADKDNVSALTPNMISIEIPEEYKDSVTIYDVVENNGILKGKITKTGIYKIKVIVSYGEEQTAELTVTIHAEKSEKIGKVELHMDTDNLRVGQPLRIRIDVSNNHGEEIIPQTITFEGVPEGINIAKYNKDNALITDDNSSQIKFINVSTTIENGGEITFYIKATGKGSDSETTTVKLNVLEMLYVNQTLFGGNILLYLEENDNTRLDDKSNICTVLPVEFKDQENNKINLTKDNVKIVYTAQELADLTLQKGEVAIVVPEVTISVGSATKTSRGLYASLYEESGNVASIGMAIDTHLGVPQVVVSSIAGKKIQIVNHTEDVIAEIPLQVVYKELAHMEIVANTALTPNSQGIYEAQLNQEFTLGTIKAGTNEGPLTANMLQEIDNDELKVSYEEDASGNVIVKCMLKKSGRYSIKPTTGTVETSNSLVVEAEYIPQITDIELSGLSVDELNVEIGNIITSNLIVKTVEKPEGEELKVKDVQISVEEAYKDKIQVFLLSSDGMEITDPENRPAQVIKGIQIRTVSGVAEDFNANITITVFADKTGIANNTITKTLSFYQAIPKYIELEDGAADLIANLSTSEWAVFRIKAYADAEHTKPVTLKYDMFRIDETDPGENVIAVTRPQYQTTNKNTGKVLNRKLDIEQRNAQNEPIAFGDTDTEVVYIAFKIALTSVQTITDPAELNGATITIQSTATGGETKTITTSYTAPTTE